MAHQLVNRKTTTSRLIDDGFNRLSFFDKTDLPRWILDDEAKHYKLNLPVTKQAMDALRAKQRALDARPIKKVAEAKARKKMKAAQRLSRAARKADSINENSELSEREKAFADSKVDGAGPIAGPCARKTKGCESGGRKGCT